MTDIKETDEIIQEEVQESKDLECTTVKDDCDVTDSIKESCDTCSCEDGCADCSCDKETEKDSLIERCRIPRIAKFEKVSFETFLTEFKPIWIAITKANQGIKAGDSFAYNEEQLIADAKVVYDNIKLPKRATKGSAGYDFSFPYGTTELNPGVSVLIPTGIKCEIAEGWVLKEYPRSSLGFNYRIQLDNTVGIIDSDYYNNPKNEGHIMIKITNDSREHMTCVLETGSNFCQGIFVPYGITIDDDVIATRKGGIGSTNV